MRARGIGVAAAASLAVCAAAVAQTGPAGPDVSQFGPGAAGQRTTPESAFHPQRRGDQPRMDGGRMPPPTPDGAMRGHDRREASPMGRGYYDRRQYGVRRDLDLHERDQFWREQARTGWWQTGESRPRDHRFRGRPDRTSPQDAAWNRGYGSMDVRPEPRDRVRVGRHGESRRQAPSAQQFPEFQHGRVRVPYGAGVSEQASRPRDRQLQGAQSSRLGQQRMMGTNEPRGVYDTGRGQPRHTQFDRDFDSRFEQNVRNDANRGRVQHMHQDRWY
jgi:hypothetical protein